MKGYLDQGDLNSALSSLSAIVGQGIVPNEITYSILIEGCCGRGNAEKAYELYCQMRRDDLFPSIFAANFLIDCFLKNKKQKQAFALFDEAVNFNAVDAFTDNILIHWLCKVDRLKEACKLRANMEDKGMKPNIFSYNMLFGYCKQGDMASAANLFDKLSASGIQTNVIAFSILVDGHVN